MDNFTGSVSCNFYMELERLLCTGNTCFYFAFEQQESEISGVFFRIVLKLAIRAADLKFYREASIRLELQMLARRKSDTTVLRTTESNVRAGRSENHVVEKNSF